MNKYRALIGAILRVLIIIAMWAWLFNLPQDTGYGDLILAFPMTGYSLALFVGAILRLNDFFLLRRWERGNVTEYTPKVKTHKSTASIVVQSSIVGITAWLLFYAVSWISTLVIAAVFTGLKLLDE